MGKVIKPVTISDTRRRAVKVLFCVCLFLLSPALRAEAGVVRLEAEDALLYGVKEAYERGGYSGGGYVTGFDEDGDRLEFRFEAERGLYELVIGYSCTMGEKGFELSVNAERADGQFPDTGESFNAYAAGKFKLGAGKNKIVISKGWGWFEIDYIELRPASLGSTIVKSPAELVDPNADAAARQLMKYLVSIYGEKTLSGQQGFKEIYYVHGVCGKYPALGAFDLMDHSPSRLERHAGHPEDIDKIIAWARQGGLVSIAWHWNAPCHLFDDKKGKRVWWRGFYSSATSYDLKQALGERNSREYKLLLRDLDAIAVQLKKLRDAGVPVLWRPLHEAGGEWFWWGAKGPEPFVELWRLMFERYTKKHGLHNLLWVYCPDAKGIGKAAWYPGDAYVDVVAPDIYSDSSGVLSKHWKEAQEAYGGRKMIGLAECGAPPDPVKMREFGVRWLWFSVWSGDYIKKLSGKELRAAYSHEDVITRDELP